MASSKGSKIPGVPPGTQAANEKNLDIVNDRLQQLDDLENSVDQKMADPAYSTDSQQAALQKVKDDIDNSKQALQAEKEIREKIDNDLAPPADADAAKADLNDLNTLRKKTYPQYYKKGTLVGNPCVPCMAKSAAKVKPALMPKDEAQAADYITGIYEGGKPDYCALADSPTDPGGLSFGKHQASETSGNLKAMLDRYSNATDPAPDGAIKAELDKQLSNHFSEDGKEYTGTDAQRDALKKTLKKACKDPAMQSTQDEFFKEQFYDPAVEKAAQYGVKSPLGKAIYYDMQIQGPGLVDGFSERALKKWSKANGVDPPATACAPDDPNGPDEKEFLHLVDAERRAKMDASTTDYHNTTYRPDGFDRLLDADNMDLSDDFVLRGQPVKGIPPVTPTTLP
jgi:hypothetical protein